MRKLVKAITSRINTLDICQINLLSKSSYSCKKLKDLHPVQYFPTTLKLSNTCMKSDLLNTLLRIC